MTGNFRILFVNHSSKMGGAETVLKNLPRAAEGPLGAFLFEEGPLVKELMQKGVWTYIAKQTKDISGIRRDSNLFKTAVPLASSLVSVVRQIAVASKKYDIIYANSQKAFILSAMAAMISKKKLVWHLHDILTVEHFNKAQIKLGVMLANAKASMVIVPSKATADAFVAAGGNKSIVHVLYNGVDQNDTSDHHSKQELRKKLGLPVDAFIYGVFSRLAPWKGQDVAIEALKYLDTNTYCLIVGDAQFGEHVYASELKDLAVRRNVEDRAIFLGHRTDIKELMSAVDIYVHPSKAAEPFSLAILEAMHSGLPVVGSSIGGVPEAVTEGATGLLVKPGNFKDMARAIRTLQSDKDQLLDMSKRSVDVARSRFTLSEMQRNWRLLMQAV